MPGVVTEVPAAPPIVCAPRRRGIGRSWFKGVSRRVWGDLGIGLVRLRWERGIGFTGLWLHAGPHLAQVLLGRCQLAALQARTGLEVHC